MTWPTTGDTDILCLILKKTRQGRDVSALVTAYVSDMTDEWVECNGDDVPSFASTEEKLAWESRELGIVHTEAEVEARFLAIYEETSVRHGRPARAARETCVIPDGLCRDTVPLELIREVARDLALNDAAEALALREARTSR